MVDFCSGAYASQKFTAPTVTGALPAITAAVSLTTFPEATAVTGLPPLVMVSVVVVAVCAYSGQHRLSTQTRAYIRARVDRKPDWQPSTGICRSRLGKSDRCFIEPPLVGARATWPFRRRGESSTAGQSEWLFPGGSDASKPMSINSILKADLPGWNPGEEEL